MPNFRKNIAKKAGGIPVNSPESTIPFALDFNAKVKKAIGEAIKKCPMKRVEIAERMNQIAAFAGEAGRMTAHILNAWTRKDPVRKVSINDLVYFCAATGDKTPLHVLIEPFGGKWITAEEVDMLEFGIAEMQRIQAEERKKTIFKKWEENNPEAKLEKARNGL